MSKENELILDNLIKRVNNCKIMIKNNETILEARNKTIYFFFVCFLYTWATIIVGTIAIFHNTFISLVISIIMIGSNLYMYDMFQVYYIKQIENDIEQLNNDLDDLANEIENFTLENDIRPSEVYKKVHNIKNSPPVATTQTILDNLDKEYNKTHNGNN